MKGAGCSSEILKRITKRYQDPVLWTWLEISFTPNVEEIPMLKQNIVSHLIFFGSKPLKVPPKGLPL